MVTEIKCALAILVLSALALTSCAESPVAPNENCDQYTDPAVRDQCRQNEARDRRMDLMMNRGGNRR
jgi:hypothetical protein